MSLEYQPLNTYLNEIRLLSLQPSKNIDGPITCSLNTVSLDDKPLFEALSYVWGDATATADIFVDGVAFSATTNLHDALEHIRPRTGDPRIMWIDAICINQNDDSERNHQVPLMQRIYSEAAAAVVWLGPSNSDHQVVLEIASYILCEEPHNNGLHALALREDRLSPNSEFPSWVPDFSCSNDAHCSRRDLFSSLVNLEDSIYDSAAKQPPFPRVSADKTILHISGLVAGTVTTILEFGASETVILEQLDQILNDIKDPHLASAWMALKTLPALVDRVHQAMSAHHDPFAGDHLEIIAHHDEYHHHLAGESSRVAAHNDENTDWWLNKAFYLAGRRLFFTNTGLFGIGGSLVEPGDSIAFLQWQRMPMLLREERVGDDEHRGTRGTFRVVGPAYVDGLMMNEWHDEELVKEFAIQTFRDFVIH
ncbi:Heterokaryon incompatibility protein 6, OR allele [Cytospora mali]|uniref:Heterokaryon incompatibility protein 6, OR allele n=1 Tax=Cytospora mali TaxID=578113 RepID=A0A194VED7_CYTMA|nr:Heterokaryon incompatibility protein 6, OR allele [Valsa mali var. pyri (nom. inval.)]